MQNLYVIASLEHTEEGRALFVRNFRLTRVLLATIRRRATTH